MTLKYPVSVRAMHASSECARGRGWGKEKKERKKKEDRRKIAERLGESARSHFSNEEFSLFDTRTSGSRQTHVDANTTETARLTGRKPH